MECSCLRDLFLKQRRLQDLPQVSFRGLIWRMNGGYIDVTVGTLLWFLVSLISSLINPPSTDSATLKNPTSKCCKQFSFEGSGKFWIINWKNQQQFMASPNKKIHMERKHYISFQRKLSNVRGFSAHFTAAGSPRKRSEGHGRSPHPSLSGQAEEPFPTGSAVKAFQGQPIKTKRKELRPSL